MNSNNLWAEFLELRARMIVHYRDTEGYTVDQIIELFRMDKGQVILIYQSAMGDKYEHRRNLLQSD